MPELTEQMYCHQQICIPPAFPYLLRQYAKAAIRTQPVDLLKWSTAYWRCLSLNVPPPVKPRLEYPIPRDFYGVTPGWLKALNYQLLNCKTVPFRILWDRWMGACLQHTTLIQLLCLGRFTDNAAVPWNRFIALCAGSLSDNLTNTMILICEILTEEPEGGSAQIPVDIFLDLYKFLAGIDASQAQTLLNLYFTDAALGILPKRRRRKKKKVQVQVAESALSSTTTEEATLEEEVEEKTSAGEASIVSCPDIASDDVYPESLEILQESAGEDSNISIATIEFNPVTITKDDERQSEEGEAGEETPHESLVEEEEEEREDTQKDEEEKKEDESVVEEYRKEDEDMPGEIMETSLPELVEEEKPGEIVETSLPELVEEEKPGEVSEVNVNVRKDASLEEKQYETMILNEAVEKYLQATETEREGEGDDYGEKVKPKQVSLKSEVKGEDEDESVEGEEFQAAYEEVYVDAIPGIGPVVPDEMVEAVVAYFVKVSSEDHGMAMPRHIRHYSCPPLEVIENL